MTQFQTRTHPHPLRTAIATAVLATAGMTSFGAMAASSASAQRPDAAARAEIQQTYRAERAACTDGSSGQDRAACLAEAAAVRKEALAGVLGLQTVARNQAIEPTEPDLMANALSRCDAVPGDVRGDCERRVMGGEAVIVVGSVAEGGILRELAPVEQAVTVAQADAVQAGPAGTVETPQAAGAVAIAEIAPVTVVVAEPTEPLMEADPATLLTAPAPSADGAVVGQGLSEGEALVPAEPERATSLLAEPLAETQTAPVLPDTSVEPVQIDAAEEPVQPGAARGADPVAYPEWMVQQRFE